MYTVDMSIDEASGCVSPVVVDLYFEVIKEVVKQGVPI
jgi:hypothetical protein